METEKVWGLPPASWRPRIGSDGISSSSQRFREAGGAESVCPVEGQKKTNVWVQAGSMQIGHFLLPLPFFLLTLSVDWMMPIGAR